MRAIFGQLLGQISKFLTRLSLFNKAISAIELDSICKFKLKNVDFVAKTSKKVQNR